MQESREKILGCLESLYPNRGEALLVEALKLVEDFKSRRPAVPEPGRALSASDAILITYADIIRRPEELPLKALAGFAEDRLSGRFSHIHLLPFFPSSSDEGFSVQDFEAVDRRWGTWDDVARIGKSFGLVFDLVLNHASAQGIWFRAFLAGKHPYDRFFVTRPPGADVSPVFRPRTHPLLTPALKDDGSEVWVWTTFSPDQVDLDYSRPEVLLAMTKALLLYLEKGARILRLDAVAFAWKETGTDCLDRPEVHVLVKYFRALLDEASPEAALLSETNLPPAINDSYFGDGDEADFVYQFALPPLALHAFVTGRSDWLTGWAAGLPQPARGRCMVNFLSSHDGIGVTPARGILPPEELDRLASAVRDRGGVVSERATPGGPVPYELNTTFFDALVDPTCPADRRIRAFLSCHALMLSLAGLPALWFHSLVGSRNWKEGPALTGSKRSIHRERLDAELLDRELDDPASERHRVFRGLLRLLAARACRQAFDPDSPQRILDLGNPLFALVRGTGPASVLAVVNVSDRRAVCRWPEGFLPSSAPFDPTAPADTARPGSTREPIPVPARAVRWVDGNFAGVF